MGNEICCQQTAIKDHCEDIMIQHLSSDIQEEQKSAGDEDLQKVRSLLSEEVNKILEFHSNICLISEPFYEEFHAQENIKFKSYGRDFYQGPVDLINRPVRIGRMYKENGAVFIGNFVSGKAEGPCFYVLKDGSYFQGKMKDNFAECEEGIFVSPNYEYSGGFHNNVFHGKGRQKSTPNNYSFEGVYEMGKKKSGVMKWKVESHEYIYQGPFDQNGKFSGKGKLYNPEGRYQGEFVNGQKHGYGIYYYKSQLRYEGLYAHNQKSGEGKLFNNDNTIAYKGIFKNGMPNGKGIATSKNGVQYQAQWIDGIDARIL